METIALPSPLVLQAVAASALCTALARPSALLRSTTLPSALATAVQLASPIELEDSA